MATTFGKQFVRLVTRHQKHFRFLFILIFTFVILTALKRPTSKHSSEVHSATPKHVSEDKPVDKYEKEKLTGAPPILDVHKSTPAINVESHGTRGPSQSAQQLPTFTELIYPVSSTVSKDRTFGTMKDGSSSSPSLRSNKKALKVILVTYYRGGSSFLGQLLEENPNAYYWFEPIQAHVSKAVPPGITMESQTNDALTITGDENKDRFIIKDILNLLECNLGSVSQSIFQSTFALKPAKAKGFQKCLSFTKFNNKSLNSCLPELARPCLESRVTSVKVIRMPLSMTEKFWKKDPDIYVVHYVRDPRGMMLSRKVMHHYKNMTKEAESVCRLMTINHHYAIKYTQERPKQFIELRYEDLALNSTSFIEKLYTFLGLDVPDILLKWLYVNTHTNDTRALSTTRLSAQTAFKWKSSIIADEKLQIDSVCYSILEKLGYPV